MEKRKKEIYWSKGGERGRTRALFRFGEKRTRERILRRRKKEESALRKKRPGTRYVFSFFLLVYSSMA